MINRPFKIYVNGTFALATMTLGKAITIAMRYFPSYIVDSRINAVVWKGEN